MPTTDTRIADSLRDATPSVLWLDRERPFPKQPRFAAHLFETFPQLEASASPTPGEERSTRARASRRSSARRWAGASRFDARVMLDLLGSVPTELTGLEMVHRRPIPFPPDPFRSIGVGLTRRAIARADEDQGRRNLWLRALDRLGVGFDS